MATSAELYTEIDQLIGELRKGGAAPLADTLHHRMHLVSWTTRGELLEELESVLTDVLQSDVTTLSRVLQTRINILLAAISEELK